ncbi:MAG: PilZ domain-containing protein [Thermodesulfovibrionia bacterium]|nr:PilZ domain-containing protein [Thermodesulfovibrionia bacterium]
MQERRKSKRIMDGFEGELLCCDTSYPGMILNLSEHGLHFVTATVKHVKDFTKETIVEIFLRLPSSKPINLVCKVIWFSDKATNHGETFTLGLELINPPQKYTEFAISIK